MLSPKVTVPAAVEKNAEAVGSYGCGLLPVLSTQFVLAALLSHVPEPPAPLAVPLPAVFVPSQYSSATARGVPRSSPTPSKTATEVARTAGRFFWVRARDMNR